MVELSLNWMNERVLIEILINLKIELEMKWTNSVMLKLSAVSFECDSTCLRHFRALRLMKNWSSKSICSIINQHPYNGIEWSSSEFQNSITCPKSFFIINPGRDLLEARSWMMRKWAFFIHCKLRCYWPNYSCYTLGYWNFMDSQLIYNRAPLCYHKQCFGLFNRTETRSTRWEGKEINY